MEQLNREKSEKSQLFMVENTVYILAKWNVQLFIRA
jgi:hypothetical protein